MPEIAASLVKQLRDKTSLPMMDCKKALQAADGDIAQAEEILRNSGALAAEKKAGRETAEGRIACVIGDCGTHAALVEIRCETAPVANTDDFIKLCSDIAKHVAISDTLAANVDQLLTQTLAHNSSQTVQQLLHDVVGRLRENMQIARFAKVADAACLAAYEHHNGQVAVLLELDCPADAAKNPEIQNLGKDLCMQVAAVQPMAVDRQGVPVDVVEKQRQVIGAQVAEHAKGKPENIIEKILQGKLNKWFNERVLLEQPFVKDDKQSVGKVVEQASKSIGQPIKVVRFLRYEVGGVSET